VIEGSEKAFDAFLLVEAKHQFRPRLNQRWASGDDVDGTVPGAGKKDAAAASERGRSKGPFNLTLELSFFIEGGEDPDKS
jgi:hypothetical protein